MINYLLFIESCGAVGWDTSMTSLSPIAIYSLSDSGGGALKSCSDWLIRFSKPSFVYVCHGGNVSFSAYGRKINIFNTNKYIINGSCKYRLNYLFLKSRRDFLKTEIWRAIFFGLEMIIPIFVHLGTFAINVCIFVIVRRWMRYHYVTQSHVFIVICVVRNTTTDSDEKDKIHFLKRTCIYMRKQKIVTCAIKLKKKREKWKLRKNTVHT